MTYRISKGDLAVTADTEAELQIAIACLSVGYERQAVNAPGWRVGGPAGWPDPPIGTAYLGEYTSEATVLPDGFYAPKLAAVPDADAPKHISVSAVNLEVLEAVMLFPEGVTSKGIQQLLGLSDTTASGRVQTLREQGLIERLPHRNIWRATELARRSKLVRA
jgi:hypothetical protein